MGAWFGSLDLTLVTREQRKNSNHAVKKQTVLDKLAVFLERYFGRT
jgi:hypothetical protein